MKFNKIVSSSLFMLALLVVSCGDEQKKEGDKVIEVPVATTNHDAPKTDVPATDMAKPADAVVITPAPTADTAVVTPPAVTETPHAAGSSNSNVTVEETHKTETTTTPAN